MLMTVCVLSIDETVEQEKIFSYFTVRARLQEKGPYSIITHIDDLKKLYLDEDFSIF